MRMRWDAAKGARLKFVSLLDQSKIKCTSSHSCLAEDGLLKLDKMGVRGVSGGAGRMVCGCAPPQFGLRNDGTRARPDGNGGCSCNHHIVDVASSILT